MALAEKKMRFKACGSKAKKQGRFRTTLLGLPNILGPAARI